MNGLRCMQPCSRSFLTAHRSEPALRLFVPACPAIEVREGGQGACKVVVSSKALGHLVRVSSTYHYASTPRLSTRLSAGDLTSLCCGGSHLGARFALRCFQHLSLPDIATQRLRLAAQLVHQRSVQPGPLVLGSAPLKTSTPTADRDRTVSRRSEPSSRTALMDEQSNPWDLIQPQDATSRHRGAKPCRRCERLGKISLLSPG